MSVRRRAASTDGHGAPPHTARLRQVAVICSLGIALLCAGWGPHGAAPFGGMAPAVQARSADDGSELRQRQIAFLHRIRQADPRYQTIEKAILNEQNELGVILNRHVEMEAVRPLDADAPHPHGEGISRTKPDSDCLRADPAAHADWDRPITRTHAADDLYPCRVPVTLTPEERKYHAWHSRRFHAPVWRRWSRR